MQRIGRQVAGEGIRKVHQHVALKDPISVADVLGRDSEWRQQPSQLAGSDGFSVFPLRPRPIFHFGQPLDKGSGRLHDRFWLHRKYP